MKINLTLRLRSGILAVFIHLELFMSSVRMQVGKVSLEVGLVTSSVSALLARVLFETGVCPDMSLQVGPTHFNTAHRTRCIGGTALSRDTFTVR